MPKDKIKVLIVKPGEKPYVTVIDNELHAMQAAVDGLIEVFPVDGDGTALVCNMNGKLNGMPGNRRMDNGDIIAGTFFIAGDNGEKFTDLPDDKIAEYSGRFDAIEEFKPEEVEDAIRIRFSEW
jgi:hypothetical protein